MWRSNQRSRASGAHRGEPKELVDELIVEFRKRMQSKLDELIDLSKPITDHFARPILLP